MAAAMAVTAVMAVVAALGAQLTTRSELASRLGFAAFVLGLATYTMLGVLTLGAPRPTPVLALCFLVASASGGGWLFSQHHRLGEMRPMVALATLGLLSVTLSVLAAA